MLTHLRALEAEAIHILREGVAKSSNPVMLYSIGKDSTVLLALARKAFGPGPLPCPLLHIDTTWKFREMISFRDRVAAQPDIELLVHQNPECLAQGINPFAHGSAVHTDLWKTQGLRQALDNNGFDLAFGGARRDEELSRAKERVFSVRSTGHSWDPRSQRPELWNLYNASLAPTQTMRVFPLSNWTELDVWAYIKLEELEVVDLYFADLRPTVLRNGQILMLDDERMPLLPGEEPEWRNIRFRTLGCYPLTAAIHSNAQNVDEVFDELYASDMSERVGRLIDHDTSGSMELKKREGYF